MVNLSGVWVALVTPMRLDTLDYKAIDLLLDRLLAAGIRGICPCGTTGEGAALTDDEFSELVSHVCEYVAGRMLVFAGTGSLNTKATVGRTVLAKSCGADGALVVTPYYVKPPQSGLYRHFAHVVESTDFPVMLYNVPGRTGVNMLPETVEKLATDHRIQAIKECAPLPQVHELIDQVGDRITVLSGEDSVYLPFLSLGGKGIVSVVANCIAHEWVRIYQCVENGNWQQALQIFTRYRIFVQTMFVDTNPIPIKYALSKQSLMSPSVRLPLCQLEPRNQQLIDQIFEELQL